MTAAELVETITEMARRAGVPLDLLEVDDWFVVAPEIVAGRWLSLGPVPEFDEVDW